MFSLWELFFSCCIVVAVAKENLLETPAMVSLANFQRIQMLRHPRLAFDWLSVSFFDYWPIRMSGLLLLYTELTLFCTELPENAFILTNQIWVIFLMYIISAQTGLVITNHVREFCYCLIMIIKNIQSRGLFDFMPGFSGLMSHAVYCRNDV